MVIRWTGIGDLGRGGVVDAPLNLSVASLSGHPSGHGYLLNDLRVHGGASA